MTLAELDALRACEVVFFEDATHPLRARVASFGVTTKEVAPSDPESDRWALVVAPDSPRLEEWARAGVRVLGGAPTAADALTAVRGAPIARSAAAAFADLVAIMARLRGPEGCPWDREQTHKSLEMHLIEEAYEVLDAIEAGADPQALTEELGDLLLQVVFHAQLGRDAGTFDIEAVARAIATKLVARHPHVFGDVEVSSAGDVVRNWEALKAREKERSDVFADLPRALPALTLAAKTQKRAAGAGFTTTPDDAATNARAALEPAADETAIGDALFWIVALARSAGIDPEGALRTALQRFTARYST
ncbi:MAG: nucleoside triphosphate pyrophosphohydrolase [Actinomycetota bacterium]|nr:nucleoside triphosphate pyrophosphohydrolase [Actinomycetota bacterium]